MSKMKTSDPEGEYLDWAVAQCNNYKYIRTSLAWDNKHSARDVAQVMVSNDKNGSYGYSPSTRWSQGGPLMGGEIEVPDFGQVKSI